MKGASRLVIVGSLALSFVTVFVDAHQLVYVAPEASQPAVRDDTRISESLRAQVKSIARILSVRKATLTLGESFRETIDLTIANLDDRSLTRIPVAGQNGMPVMGKFTALMAFDIDSDGRLQAAIVEYVEFLGGGRHDQTGTYLKVFVLTEGKLLSQTSAIEIGHTDIVLTQVPNGKWRWHAADLRSPAIVSASRVLSGDTNGDGLRDLLVWTKVTQSRRVDDSRPEFALAEERLSVMQFDSKTQTFQEPVATKSLPMPSGDLWERLPAISWVRMP